MLSRIKRHGALLAKSRVVGVQFEALFTDALYFNIGTQAVRQAQRLRQILVSDKGYPTFIDSPTNQQFFIVPNADLDALHRTAGFENLCPVDDDHTAVRFVTSWATTDDEVDELAHALRSIRAI
jgi:threonine aldolase